MDFIDNGNNLSGTVSSSTDLPKLHPGQYDLNHCDRHSDYRDDFNRKDGWRLHQRFWLQRHIKRCFRRPFFYLYNNDCRGRISDGDSRKICWSHRDRGYYQSNRTKLCQKFAFNLLPVIFLLPFSSQVKAQEVNATANPIATSSGSVSNQAVQINQGGFSKQGFSNGHYCNSSTLTLTPFYLGNDVHPSYVRNQNYGLQMTLSVPLDGRMVELCKSLAEKRLQKERLDYSLIRALKCAELLGKGFMFRPESPYAVVCADVVPIALAPKTASQPSSSAAEQ